MPMMAKKIKAIFSLKDMTRFQCKSQRVTLVLSKKRHLSTFRKSKGLRHHVKFKEAIMQEQMSHFSCHDNSPIGRLENLEINVRRKQ
jgi:hypothetical protein